MLAPEKYWEAIQGKICTKCVDGNSKGECLIDASEECMLKTHFSAVLASVNSVYSPSIEPYEEVLRKNVCSNCSSQPPDGRCRRRDDLSCSLDRYFPLIVEVIEDTQLRGRLG